MRMLHTSDWHLGRFLNSFSLIDDQAHFLNWLLKLIKSEKIDILAISGDIYNTATPSAIAVSLLDEFLTKAVVELKIKVILISGNHDSAEKLNFSSKILQKNNLFIAGGLKNFQTIEFDIKNVKVQFFMLPFFSYAQAREFFHLKKSADETVIFNSIFKEKINEIENNYFKILCAHGLFISGNCSLTYCDSEINVGGSEAFNLNHMPHFNYLALGHLHGPQKVSKNGFYCGSPIKYSISESNHKKRVIVVDILKNNDYKLTEIYTEPLHDLRILKGKFSDLIKIKTNDYVSFQLTDSNFILGLYGKLCANCPNILELKFVNLNFGSAGNLSQLKTKQPNELFEEFYTNIVNRKMNATEQKILSEVLCELNNETD